MTKTISQKLRELAQKPYIYTWNEEDRAMCDVCHQWCTGLQSLDDLNTDEWLLFCNLVACALESEQ
jgi:hypothetical protein